MRSLLLSILIGIAWPAVAADGFSGHYELAKKSSAVFALDIRQNQRHATAAFSAGHVDGSGAAPDGEGQGGLTAKGELEFRWTDSFENAGTAILRREGKLYHLSMNVQKMADARAASFYGEVTLRLVSRKPRAATQ